MKKNKHDCVNLNQVDGFTLLELLIVIIIIGILATLAFLQYKPYRENTLDKEAEANLKLVYAAQRIYKFESDDNIYLVPIANNTDINTNLKLQLATTSPNWNYIVQDCTSGGNSLFYAKATRTADDGRSWCIESPLGGTPDPVPYKITSGDCSCPS